MRRCLLFTAFTGSVYAVAGQEGSFLALDNNKQLFIVHTGLTQGSCRSTQLNLCSNVGSPLSIGLAGNTLYFNDNQGNLYSTLLDSTGAVGNCKLIGNFISKSRAIYGLTVGPDSVVYAGSGNLIETYDIKTGTFGTLGRLPSNYKIGGDLMFYNGSLFEACTNTTTGNNELVLVNLSNPSASTQYLPFTSGTIFGFASITKRCSFNQSFALGQAGDIYKVDMANKTQDPTPYCILPFNINDAASLAETQTEAPPLPPAVISPAIYCVNTPSTQLTATISTIKDTLRWYTVASGGNATGAPFPTIGSSPSTITYYISQYDTATTCEGERAAIVVNVDSIINPSISISTTKTDICAGQTIGFMATDNIGTTNPTFQWMINGQNVGNNKDTFSTKSIANNDKITCVLNTKLSCATNPATVSNELIIASTQSSYPTISIKASDSSFCPGTSITFVATKTVAGTSQVQHWMVNGMEVNNNTDTFITKTLVNGDIVSCNLITSGKCVFPDTAISNTIKLSVTAKILPTVTITADTTAACAGSPINFSSTETHGGLQPAYQWKVNGRDVMGATSNTLTITSLNNQDVVTCRMISDANCLISNSATSNDIVITITPNPVPSIQIAASDTIICKGANVSFNASVKNAGTSPIYQWLVNGKDVGVNTIGFSSSSFNNDDTVTCRFIVNTACAGLDTATSNTIVIKYASLLKPTIVISADTTTICTGEKVTFKSAITYGGNQPVYSWKKNGVTINGAVSDTLMIDSIADGDMISGMLVSSIPCLSINNANSSPVTINVKSLPIIPTITGSNSICVNKTTTLFDMALGGTWSSDAISIATIDNTGIITGIAAGNAIISYAKTNGCGTTTQTYPITVSSNILGSIIGESSICKGDSTQFSNSSAISGNWISANSTIATISKNGIVHSVDTGTTTILYVISNACGTDTLYKTLTVSGEKPLGHPFSIEQPTCIKPFSGEVTIDVIGAEMPYRILLNADTSIAPTTISKLEEGNYPVYIYNRSRCLVDSITDISLKMPEDGSCRTIHVATAFAPNSTVGNNLLRPIGGNTANIKNVIFKVFNRFGNKVYESHSLYNGWDGRVNGTLQNADTYIWYLEYKLTNDTAPINLSGTSVLLR